MLADTVTMLVGQSGVGKSSLVNALAPQAEALTAELTRDAEGRHTTTTARRCALDADTAIIDAPGVRDFAPPRSILRAAERGFVEIHARSARLPLQQLPSHGRTGLRGAQRRIACHKSRRAAMRATGVYSGCTRNSREQRALKIPRCARRAHAPACRHPHTRVRRPPARRARCARP